ncbi:MAG: exodeoxyribonuclease VII small subunit [Erysipelotrichaceae bacterium]|nr:exodeoxyribonuclease VII small subunit [Erysipelotrichaceae bacterium]
MEQLTFEQAMKRLDEIASQLEKNDLPLEEAIKVFEEGLSLAAGCESQLKEFEGKMQEVLTKHGMEQTED